MFDVSFSELLLIGVIALIVIGPERLPKVARTVGHLLGRAQRYVSDVKTDIRREMDAEEFSKLKDEMEEAKNTIRASVDNTKNSLKNPLEEAQSALKEAAQSINETTRAATSLQDTASVPDATSLPDTVSPQLDLLASDPATADKPTASDDIHVPSVKTPASTTPEPKPATTPSNETST